MTDSQKKGPDPSSEDGENDLVLKIGTHSSIVKLDFYSNWAIFGLEDTQ